MNIITFNDTFEFLLAELSSEEMEPIESAVEYILIKNFNGLIKVNNELAGNIEKEFSLPFLSSYVKDLIMPLLFDHNKRYDYINKNYTVLSKDCELVLSSVSPWINFQKKHEFNPIHNHRGIYSFVIWINIPYNIEDENNTNHSKEAFNKKSGHFEFVSQRNNSIDLCPIAADSSYNRKIAIFPSSLHHCVYPFFTSDNYRITMSGNFVFKI